MNVIEIKGIVPGSGKSTLLVKFFKKAKSNLKEHSIILTPSNKARQEIINKFIEIGIDKNKAEKYVKTFRDFKRNFFRHYNSFKYIDMESGELVEEKSNLRFISKESDPHFKKVYNIFIDEASMISNKEMKDLTDNWKIRNLVLCGDSLQFDPISKCEILESEDGDSYKWIDNGQPYDITSNVQVLLNKNMRSKDGDLKQLLEEIKAGTPSSIMNALVQLTSITKDCENKNTDWHIAYTNNKCNHLNQMYLNPKRYIVVDNYTKGLNPFYKSEIIDIDSPRLKDLEESLLQDSIKDNKLTFEDWKRRYLKPAYGLTCHKLQGSTITGGQIYIHLDDLIQAMSNHIESYKEKAYLFQKFLYVACSRAVHFNQLNLFGSLGISKKGKKFQFTLSEKLQDEEYKEEFMSIIKAVRPMTDESIKEDCLTFGDYDYALVGLLSALDYRDEEIRLTGQDEYDKKVSKAHSVPHKPHKHKMPDDFIELSNLLNERDWCKATELARSSYYNARKIWLSRQSSIKATSDKVTFLKIDNDSKLSDDWTILNRFDEEGEYNPNGDQVCVNKPLDGQNPNRTDKRVKKENYLFECDNSDKIDQVKLIEALPDNVKECILWINSTGGKSFHVVIHTNTPDNASSKLRQYIHKNLNSKLFNGKADPSTYNSARLARAPNAIRQDNKHYGANQVCLHFNLNAIPLNVDNLIKEFEEEERLQKALNQLKEVNRRKSNSEIHTLEELKKWNESHPSKAKKECIKFLEGILEDWNRGIACVRSLRNYGFSDDDILSEGQYDDKWIKSAIKGAK